MTKGIVIVFNSLDTGGIERKITDICQHYSENPNIKLTLLLKENRGEFLKYIPKNISIDSPDHTKIHQFKALTFAFWLIFRLKRINPELIISFGSYCSILSLLAAKMSFCTSKIIISEDSSIDEQLESEKFKLLRKLLIYFLYPIADKIIVLTGASAEKLKKLSPKSSSKVTIIGNWLPFTFSKPVGNTPKPIDILFVGRFAAQKNPLSFIRIINRLKQSLPSLKVVMVGKGPLIFQIKSAIKNLGLSKTINITYSDDPSIFYQKSKILLISSDHEGFPLTLLESSFFYCLPVCHQIPEIKDFLTYRTNELFYKTETEASLKIKKLLSNQNKLKVLSRHYQKMVDTDGRKNFQTTTTLFEKFI